MQKIKKFLVHHKLIGFVAGFLPLLFLLFNLAGAQRVDAQQSNIPDATYTYREVDGELAIVKEWPDTCFPATSCQDIVYKLTVRPEGNTIFIFSPGSGQLIEVDAKDPPGPGVGSLKAGASSVTIEINNVALFNETFPDAANPTPSDNEEEGEEEGCDAGAFSWIVCEVIKFVDNTMNWIKDKVLVPFLTISPLDADDQPTSGPNGDGDPVDPTFVAWKNVRNLANVLLIPIFMIIIFSQALSLNIDAYTIKKMLPRLIAAAIMIQFSFYIVSILVDITNVLGAGIDDLVARPVTNALEVETGNEVASGGVFALSGLGLVLGAFSLFTTIAGGWGALFLLVLPALIAMLGVLLTIVFRQILVILLAMLAPVAFVAFVLPGTDRLFKMWRDTLVRALMMYPLIILLFAAGTIIAVVSTNLESSPENFVGTFIAMAAVFAPLFLVPFTFKFAGSALASIHGGVSKLASQLAYGKDGKSGLTAGLRRDVEDKKYDSMMGDNPSWMNRKGLRWAGKMATFGARPGLGFTKKDEARAMENFKAARNERMGLLEKENLKPETHEEMYKHGNDMEEYKQRIVELEKEAIAENNNDKHVIAEQMRNQVHRVGKSSYLAAYGELAAAAGMNDEEMFYATKKNFRDQRLASEMTGRLMHAGKDATPQFFLTGMDNNGNIRTADGIIREFELRQADGSMKKVYKVVPDGATWEIETDEKTGAQKLEIKTPTDRVSGLVKPLLTLGGNKGVWEKIMGADGVKDAAKDIVKRGYNAPVNGTEAEVLAWAAMQPDLKPSVKRDPEAARKAAKKAKHDANNFVGNMRRNLPNVSTSTQAVMNDIIDELNSEVGLNIPKTVPMTEIDYLNPMPASEAMPVRIVNEDQPPSPPGPTGTQQGPGGGGSPQGGGGSPTTPPAPGGGSVSGSLAAPTTPPVSSSPSGGGGYTGTVGESGLWAPETPALTSKQIKQQRAAERLASSAAGTRGTKPIVGDARGNLGAAREMNIDRAQNIANTAAAGTSGQQSRRFVGSPQGAPEIEVLPPAPEPRPYKFAGMDLTESEAKNIKFNNSDAVIEKNDPNAPDL